MTPREFIQFLKVLSSLLSPTDTAHLHVSTQTEDSRGRKPKLTLHVPVLVLRFCERWVFVEERSYEGHVELSVSRHDIVSGDKLSAAEALRLFEHTLRSLCEILLLETDTL